MPVDVEQQKIWSHFQTEQTEVFERSDERLDALLRLLAKLCPPSSRILNVGIGNAYFERRALDLNYDVKAIDLDPQTVSIAIASGIGASVGSVKSLPYGESSLEAAFASEVFEHLEPAVAGAGAREIARVLAPGGYFVGTVPYRENLTDNTVFCPHCGTSFHKWGHRQSFDLKAIRALVPAELELQRLRVQAFVSFRRGPMGIAKSTARWVLGRMGEAIADPHILWVARKNAITAPMP